jgi:WD40 repeat protein
LATVYGYAVQHLGGEDGKVIKTLDAIRNLFGVALAWSKDGNSLAIGTISTYNAGFGVSVWDIHENLMKEESLGHSYRISDIAWFAEKKKLATLDSSNRMLIEWDLETHASGHVLQGTRWFSDLTWSADGKGISDTDGKNILVWDVPTGNLKLLLEAGKDMLGDYVMVRDMALNPDGTRYAAVVGDDSRELFF